MIDLELEIRGGDRPPDGAGLMRLLPSRILTEFMALESYPALLKTGSTKSMKNVRQASRAKGRRAMFMPERWNEAIRL